MIDSTNFTQSVQPQAQTVPVPLSVPPSVSPPTMKNTGYKFNLTRPQWMKIGLAIGGVIILVVLFSFLKARFSLPRTVTAIGTSKQQFDADTAQVTVMYSSRGNDKNALTNTSTSEFKNILDEIQNSGADSVAQSASVILPSATAGSEPVYEYRQAAIIKVTGKEKIPLVLSLIQKKNLLVAQTTYLPKEDMSVQSSLLNAALDSSHQKAAELAKSSHTHLGNLLSVTEVNSTSETGNVLSSTSTKSAAGDSGQFAQIELQKSVSATYELW